MNFAAPETRRIRRRVPRHFFRDPIREDSPLLPAFASFRPFARTLGASTLALVLCTMLNHPAHAGGTLTVAMTAGDVPVTTGNPDQGFEGYRFVGYNLYDGL